MRLLRLTLGLALCCGVYGQTISTASLTGRYFARHVEFTTDTNNNVTDARSIAGTITFIGTDSYVFIGQQVVGTGTAASYTASGTYSVSAAGVVTLSNPQKPAVSINARYAVEAVIGSGTEAADNTFDLFVAIPSAGTQNNNSLTGTFYAADFELTGAATSQVRDSLVTMTMDGAGNMTTVTANGHAANVNSGAISSANLTGGSYSVPGQMLTFPGVAGVATSAALLNSAPRMLAVSNSGNVIVAATTGAHDILIGIKALGANGTNSSLVPSFWLSGLRVDSAGAAEGYAGAGETIGGVSITSTERLHETGSATALDVTESDSYTVAADGTGSYGPSKIAIGIGGNLMVKANLSAPLDPTGYEIAFAAASPQPSGTGVFIKPQGVVNAASGAPGVDAISPGEFIAIYGTGLAGATVSALPPYPMSLGGVSVRIGGLPAAIYFVSAGQIDCLVPFGVSGASVNIVVTNGATSNTVSVPLAKTSPGAFSLDTTGTGDGALLHLDNTLVNAASPATKGEIVQLYMTGLGALTTPVADGHGATAADFAVTPLAIYVNDVQVPAAGVLYSGLSSLPGLYQINFQVPKNLTVSGELPLAILTPDAFHDQVNIAVQ